MIIDSFLATGQAPDSYAFSGDVITAHVGQTSEDFDLSGLQEGDELEGVEPATLDLPGMQIIRDAERLADGLHVTLCQATDSGDWKASGPVDSADYDSETQYINEL